MRVTLISENDETSIGRIVDRLYVGLTADKRQRAEIALQRANPQLTEDGAFRVGAVVVVPGVPGLAITAEAIGRDPVDDVPVGLLTAVKGYRETLDRGLRMFDKDTDRQINLLETNQFDADASLVEGLRQSLEARKQAVDESLRVQNDMFQRVLQDISDW